MTAVETARRQLRGRRRRPEPEPWFPPKVHDFLQGTAVMGCDATLSHFGWLVAEASGGEVLVHDKGTINIETGMSGYLATWEKARLLQARLLPLLKTYQGVRKVVEAPAVAGSRTESSLIAGMLVWLETGGCPQVSAMHVARVLCGSGRLLSADRKKAVRVACARYVPASATRAWNEHERDALALVLAHLHDLQEARAW